MLNSNTISFFYNQFPALFFIIIFGLILTHKSISKTYTIFSIIFILFYSYFAHIFIHIFPKELLNFHLLIHHNKNYNKTDNIAKTIFGYLVELGINISIFAILYVIQKIVKIETVPPIILLYFGIIYISNHMINYTIFHIGNHPEHHDHDNDNDNDLKYPCNYSLDMLDHLFGTNCNSTFENMNHLIINIIISFVVVTNLKKYI